MKKNMKIIMMMVFVAFALSCASTSEIQTQASQDGIIKQLENQTKVEEEKEEPYQPRDLPAFYW